MTNQEFMLKQFCTKVMSQLIFNENDRIYNRREHRAMENSSHYETRFQRLKLKWGQISTKFYTISKMLYLLYLHFYVLCLLYLCLIILYIVSYNLYLYVVQFTLQMLYLPYIVYL